MTFAMRPTSNANAYGVLLNGQGSADNRVRIYENRTTEIRVKGTIFTAAFRVGYWYLHQLHY